MVELTSWVKFMQLLQKRVCVCMSADALVRSLAQRVRCILRNALVNSNGRTRETSRRSARTEKHIKSYIEKERVCVCVDVGPKTDFQRTKRNRTEPKGDHSHYILPRYIISSMKCMRFSPLFMQFIELFYIYIEATWVVHTNTHTHTVQRCNPLVRYVVRPNECLGP